MTGQIREGDWVVFEQEGRKERNSQGHVAYIDKLGQIQVRFGDRETPACDLGFSFPIDPQYIVQVWRGQNVIKHSSFKKRGTIFRTRNVKPDWAQIK